MKVALAQIDLAWENPVANLGKVKDMVEEAESKGADLIIFPEMTLTGFTMSPSSAALTAASPELAKIVELTRRTKAVVILGAAIRATLRNDTHFTNQAWVIKQGKVLGTYSKMNLFSYSGEDKAYSAGDKPFLFEMDGLNYCPFICYDLRFPELFLSVADQVTGGFIVIANWPSAREDNWKTLLRARALDTQTTVIGVNRVGTGGEIQYSGASAAFGAKGETLMDFKSAEGLFVFDFDPKQTAHVRETFPTLKDRAKLLPKL